MKIASMKEKTSKDIYKDFNLISFDNFEIDKTYIDNNFHDIIISKYFYIQIYFNIFHILYLAEIQTKYPILKIYNVYSISEKGLINLLNNYQALLKRAIHKQINPQWDESKYTLISFLIKYNICLCVYFLKYKFNQNINISDLDFDFEHLYNKIIDYEPAYEKILYCYYYDNRIVFKNTIIKIFNTFDFYYCTNNIKDNNNFNDIIYSRYNIKQNKDNDNNKNTKLNIKFINIKKFFEITRETIMNNSSLYDISKNLKYNLQINKDIKHASPNINNKISTNVKINLNNNPIDLSKINRKSISVTSKYSYNLINNGQSIYKTIKKNTIFYLNDNNLNDNILDNKKESQVINSKLNSLSDKHDIKDYTNKSIDISTQYSDTSKNNIIDRKNHIFNNNFKNLTLSTKNIYKDKYKILSNNLMKDQPIHSNIDFNISNRAQAPSVTNSKSNNVNVSKNVNKDDINEPKNQTLALKLTVNKEVKNPNNKNHANTLENNVNINPFKNNNIQDNNYDSDYSESMFYVNDNKEDDIIKSKIIPNNNNNKNDHYFHFSRNNNNSKNPNINQNPFINKEKNEISNDLTNNNNISFNHSIPDTNANISIYKKDVPSDVPNPLNNDNKDNNTIITLLKDTQSNLNKLSITVDKVDKQMGTFPNYVNNQINSAVNTLYDHVKQDMDHLHENIKQEYKQDLQNMRNQLRSSKMNSKLKEQRQNEAKNLIANSGNHIDDQIDLNNNKNDINDDLDLDLDSVDHVKDENDNNNIHGDEQPKINNEEPIGENLIQDMLEDLNVIIKSYKLKYESITISLTNFVPNINVLKKGVSYSLNSQSAEVQRIIKSFPTLEICHPNSNLIKEKLYDVVNLIVRYKDLLIHLLNNNTKFINTYVNYETENDPCIFKRFCVPVNRNARILVTLHEYFKKKEDFNESEEDEYKSFRYFISKDVDILMYILGLEEFYFYKDPTRGTRNIKNNFCLICKSATNDYYAKRHLKNKTHIRLEKDYIEMNKELDNLDAVANNTFYEDMQCANVFKRMKYIYSNVDSNAFITRLKYDISNDHKKKMHYIKMILKFILLSNTELDEEKMDLMMKISNLACNRLISVILYICNNLN